MEKYFSWLTTALLLSSVYYATSLQCYACADTGPNNKCQRHETYVDALSGKRPELLKNCTSPYNEVCYVETFSANGFQVSHIRDCGDGQTFSYRIPSLEISSVRLNDLSYNNETVCVFTGKFLLCLSKCNTTDFCNGPLVSDISRASAYNTSLLLIMLLCSVLFIQSTFIM